MSKVIQVKVAYRDVNESVNIKRLKYRQQMRLFGVLRQGIQGDQEPSPDNVGNYQVELIAACVCNADGKTLYTPDDVDSWAEEDGGGEKVVAYTRAITAALSPSEATVAKNS